MASLSCCCKWRPLCGTCTSCRRCRRQVNHSWHVARKKKCYINCIHRGSFRHLVMQLSTVSPVPFPPLPLPLSLLAGRQFVSRQERTSSEGNKKRPAEVECQQLDSSNWGPSLSPSPSPARGSFVFGYACLGANEAAASSVSCCQCTRVSLRYNTQWSGEERERENSVLLSLSVGKWKVLAAHFCTSASVLSTVSLSNALVYFQLKFLATD